MIFAGERIRTIFSPHLLLRIGALLSLYAAILSCSPHPQWIRRLPLKTGPVADALRPGIWIRPVTSRYSILYDRVSWQGMEKVEITTGHRGFSYQKIHDYIEWREGHFAVILYREEGELELALPWVLFRPKKAVQFRRSGEQLPNSFHGSKSNNSSERGTSPEILLEIRLADNRSHTFTPVSLPPPLLYFLGSKGRTLTPLTFERFGEWHEHGIFEGCDRPFDSSSSSFRRRYTYYTEKTTQTHRYVLEER